MQFEVNTALPVGLLSSPETAKLPPYYSLHHCPGTSGVDALVRSWAVHNAYAMPRFNASVHTATCGCAGSVHTGCAIGA